jgi:mannobiose 2-epimerase
MHILHNCRHWAHAVPIVVALIVPASVQAGPPSIEEVRQLRLKITRLLEAELTGHWYPNALDKELGGFHQNFARDWTPRPDDNRFLVYQARMTWTAAAYAEFNATRRDEYIGYARAGIEYLDRVMRDTERGGFSWVLDLQGKVDAKLGDEKHVYGTAFVLYAASKAFEVTRDPRALQVARDTFDWLEGHAHDPEHGGYFEAFRRDGTPILIWDENAPISRRLDRLGTYYGFKSMNSHIHLLEALAEFQKIEKSALAKTRLAEVHAIVRDRIAAEPGGLNLYLTRQWQATPAHDSFGHDIETAFLLVEAAHALGVPDEPKTLHMARRLVDHALEWGWDTEHGGFYYKGEAFGGEAFDQHKDWWTQAEGWNALLLMHLKFGATTDRYWQAFRKEWAFIEGHLIDPEHGGWYMETSREGKLLGDGRKASQWKANYHTARAMMGVATMLGEMERTMSSPR